MNQPVPPFLFCSRRRSSPPFQFAVFVPVSSLCLLHMLESVIVLFMLDFVHEIAVFNLVMDCCMISFGGFLEWSMFMEVKNSDVSLSLAP